MTEPLPAMTIQSHRGPYQVRFGALFEGLENGLNPGEYLIIDERVARLYSKPLEAVLSSGSVLKIEATEENKSLEKFSFYVECLLAAGVKRDSTLVAVGGGILQDIAAFIAATLHRGIAWRFYPTTLLAQADSCIGSKSSVNVGRFKNQMGTFTPPQEILISSEVLESLGQVEIQSGIGEMIKVHIISGWDDVRTIAADYPKLFSDKECLVGTIWRSLEIKKQKIEIDEFDKNERLIMNYGHSFGHAIESATGYAVPHGIAVTLGMDMANEVSLQKGLLDQETYDELHLLLTANYAGFEDFPIPEEPFFSALAKDKKNSGGELTLILLRGPGKVFRGHYPHDASFRSICTGFFERLKSMKGVSL